MAVLSKYGVHDALLASVLVATAASPFTARASDAELIDIAGRIDYGYYAGDSRVVAAARADLERLRVSHNARSYYLGYSAYRLSQLTKAENHRAHRELLTSCIDAARAALDDSAWAVEAWVLIAACALEGRTDPGRGLGYDLRLSEALDAARGLDPDHPRLLLVEAAALGSDEGKHDGVRSKLVAAREQFDAWSSKGAEPTWGRAEIFANLAASYLDDGDRREARDLIEQSLLEAPGYHFALELQNRLSLAR